MDVAVSNSRNEGAGLGAPLAEVQNGRPTARSSGQSPPIVLPDRFLVLIGQLERAVCATHLGQSLQERNKRFRGEKPLSPW